MFTLELHLLGTSSIRVNGRVVSFRTRRALALLAYLVLEGPQARESLMALLWPEASESNARLSLRSALTHLREGLGEAASALRANRDVVQLELDGPLRVDVLELEAAAQLVQFTEPKPDVLTQLEAVAALWHGEFLAGVNLREATEFSNWLALQREHWLESMDVVLERLMRLHANSVRFDQALLAARKRVQLDRLNESAYRDVIRLQLQVGDRVGALETYAACVQALRDELGIVPSQVLEALHNQALQAAIRPAVEHKSKHSVQTLNAPQPPSTLEHSRLVGREQEWAQLEEAWTWRDRHREHAQQLAQHVLQHPASTPLLRAQAQVVTAYLAFRKGRMADALEQDSQAITMLHEHNATAWLARAMNVQVCVTGELGEFTIAGVAVEEQLRYSRAAGDMEMEGCALHDLGMIQFQRSPKLAKPHLNAALEVFTKMESRVGQAFTKINLAQMHEQLGQYELAQMVVEETLELATTEGIPLVETLARAHQGRVALQQEQYEWAETLLLDALERAIHTRERILWEVIPSLVKIHLQHQRPHQAIGLLEEHLCIIRDAGLRPFEVSAHELLAEVLHSIGEDRAALAHYRAHMTLYRQLFTTH